ncbi:MAG: 50S ribosomal protein L32 [Candidatus Omnitrophica bacterium]|nr:50S ribosomal protein L32 [Candidatus Omnitrophota bacterium]
MALPKRRHSITRGRKRRTHWKIDLSQTVICPQCKQRKLPHRVCPFCGFYKGREVIKIETVEERKKRKEKRRERRKKK